MQQVLQNSIDTATAGEAYQNYLQIRPWVLDMMTEAQARSDAPSDYWQEEAAGFDYMLDASPLIVEKLREHCDHITGIRSYEYREHHEVRKRSFELKFAALRELDHSNLFVSEARELGGFGHDIQGHMINIDTLKFYECLIALDSEGMLDKFMSQRGDRKTVIEIGAGWGGFAYQFKKFYPDTCYVIVDLPQTLLFSATYLRTLYPDASVFMYGIQPISTLVSENANYDLVFLPHFAMDELELEPPELAVNICSYQEMTSEQVAEYARRLWELGCPSIYSLNRDRSPYNNQLTTVTSILSTRYDLSGVDVLPVPYNDLDLLKPEPEPPDSLMYKLRHPRRTLNKLKAPAEGAEPVLRVRSYRHLVGTRRTDSVA